MKALLFAAGLGTRLKPLTNNKPKALVELNGIPMLQRVIQELQNFGINNFVINVHHFADKIIEFLTENSNFGATIEISDETDQLLETGGGLKFARKYLENEDFFLVYNVDIFSDINIGDMIKLHMKNDSLVTLAVQDRNASRRLVFDEKNYLCAWENIVTGEIKSARNPIGKSDSLSFSGIHIINSDIFDLIQEKGKFSIIDVYLRIAGKNKISAYKHNESFMFDLGKPENILAASEYCK